MTIGSLFSGIGGLELGLERAGLGPVLWQCEIDPFARRVLAKHWPHATCFPDITTLENPPYVDILCGGFPCQDISFAGCGAGLDGARSGLWREYVRVIRQIRPRYVIVENVTALLVRGLDRVLGDLASLGYDAEWATVSACSVGAPHMRRRVFVVAYPNGQHGRAGLWNPASRPAGALQGDDGAPRARAGWAARLANPSELYGGADGLPDGMDRNHAIGNAVVPQVAEVIGRLTAGRRMTEAQSNAAVRNGAALETDLARFHATLRDWMVIQQHPRCLAGRIIGKGAPDFLAVSSQRSVLFDAKSITRPAWPVSLLEPHQAAMLEAFSRVGTAGVYLRTSLGDAWLPWATVRPVWQDHWQKRGTRALSIADGVLVTGCDWTAACG